MRDGVQMTFHTRTEALETNSDSSLVVSLSAGPAEVVRAVWKAADCLDLGVVEELTGSLLLRSRSPGARARIKVRVVSQVKGSQLQLSDATRGYVFNGGYARALMGRVRELVETASNESPEEAPERGRLMAVRSRELRVGQTVASALGLLLVFAALLYRPPWVEVLAVLGWWLVTVGTWSLEMLRHRVIRASSRADLIALGWMLFLAVALTCALLLR